MCTKDVQTVIYFIIGYIICIMLLAEACVAAEPTPAIVTAVKRAGDKYGIDPNLLLAIIEVESNFNPKARGKAGEIGLMQLHPKYFSDIPTSISGNISLGARYLAYVRQHCPNKRHLEFITCYNKGTKRALLHPTSTKYYRKVIKNYHKRTLTAYRGIYT